MEQLTAEYGAIMDNPLLALQVQPSTIDIPGSLGKGEEIQSAKLGNMLRQYQLTQAQRQDALAMQKQNILRTLGPGLASGDPMAVSQYAQIDPTGAQGFQKGALENKDAQIKATLSNADLAGRTFGMLLNTPPAQQNMVYSSVRQQAQGLGIDTSHWPDQYDPAFAQSKVAQAVSVKDQIQQHLDAVKQAETGRHDLASEGTAAMSARAAMISATKPQSVAIGSSLVGPTGKVVFDGNAAMGGTAEPAKADAAAPNITGQTGLSMNGFNYLVGNTSALSRDKVTRNKAAAEAGAFAAKSGTDIASLQSQYKAYNNVLQNNLQKSNQMDILNNELQGTVKNLAPVADNLGGGNFRWTKDGAQFIGGLANSPNAQQYVTYLNQLRADLAGFNAVSAGKMTENGNARTDESDFHAAEQVIKNGIDSGGANGLAQAIQITGEKNKAVVGHAVDNANRGIWGLFGVGQNYKNKNDAPVAGTVPAPQKTQSGATVSNWPGAH